MSTYAIGDIQGCFNTLQKLLEHIKFNAQIDNLWFTGDLVNRGNQSLETLRFVYALGKHQRTVLGNHDLHLLAVSKQAHPGWQEDTLADIFAAPDKSELLAWLAQQPLLHHDEELNYIMVHAGLSSQWDLKKSVQLAHEVEAIVRSDKAFNFFEHMYGNLPDQWHDDLTGWDRLRCITNFFTRTRFCHSDGRMDLAFKGKLASHPDKLIPWFNVPNRQSANLNIIFGHWAALGGMTNTPRTFALDTGCVWGFKLTAMRLEDKKIFQVDYIN
jgi:bis(5'-nucleosyl)-tetraphosphatase (symmetrical)